MKKRKQILSVLLASVMVTSMLAGCGSEQVPSNESSVDVSSQETESAKKDSVSEQETSSDAVDDSSVRISEETIELTVVAPSNVT